MRRILCVFLAFSFIACSSSGRRADVGRSPQVALFYDAGAKNSSEAMEKPYVILISIDGYRFDFNKVFSPPNLNQIAQKGVRADSLRPVYPSKTFPNHYSLVTGLYADRHGIVSNEFHDPARDRNFALQDRKAVEDGSWYFGEPIWMTAGRQGMLSASYFWVGSEADILGGHPNYYFPYDEEVPYETRVDQVLEWLKLPESRRPHFIALYLEGADSAAHTFGLSSPEMKDAVLKVDAQIGRLREGVRASRLPVNIVVVSDHGLVDLDPKKTVLLDEMPNAARLLAKFHIVGRGPQMLLYLKKGEDPKLIEETEKVLRKNARHFRVWRREKLDRLKYFASPRVGDLVIEPDLPYLVGMRGAPPNSRGANHGWDAQKNKLMHGIFLAEGPAFKESTRLPTIEIVNVYPLLLEILGLKQRYPIDGLLEPFKPALRSSR